MNIVLTDQDIILHQVDCDHPSGVPVVWALAVDSSSSNTFVVISREMDDEEPWQLDWRGDFERCQKRYRDAVTEAIMGDTLHGVPANGGAALRQAEVSKIAARPKVDAAPLTA